MRGLAFMFPMFFGLLFVTGRGFVFGLDGVEPSVIMFPKNEIVGWLLVSFSLMRVIPPWMVAKGFRLVKRIWQ